MVPGREQLAGRDQQGTHERVELERSLLETVLPLGADGAPHYGNHERADRRRSERAARAQHEEAGEEAGEVACRPRGHV